MSAKNRIHPVVWDCIPTAIVVGCFALIALINWDYQRKFFQPVMDHGIPDYYMGPVLLIIGFGLSLASSGFLYMIRECWSERGFDGRDQVNWRLIVFLGFISLILFLMSLSIIVLGPAAFTMMEQLG